MCARDMKWWQSLTTEGRYVPMLLLAMWVVALLLNLVVLAGVDLHLGDNNSWPSLAISAAIMALALLDAGRARPRHHAFHAFGAPFIAIVIQSYWLSDDAKATCTLAGLKTIGPSLDTLRLETNGPSVKSKMPRDYDFRCNLFFAATAAVCAAYAAGLGQVMARALITRSAAKPTKKTAERKNEKSQLLSNGPSEERPAIQFGPLRLP